MKKYSLLFIFCIEFASYSQVSQKSMLYGLFFAKGYSKEISIYRAKSFIMSNVLGLSGDAQLFTVEALAAAGGGELTSLFYNCPQKNKSGLILGFYNDYWNDNGVTYQGYKFKDISKERAIELFNRIDSLGSQNDSFLNKDRDNNVFFTFDDLTFLLYNGWNSGSPIRIFWNGFDVEWDAIAYRRSEDRFLKKIEPK